MDAAKSALQLKEEAKVADCRKYDCVEDPLWKREKDAYFYNVKNFGYNNTKVLPNGKGNVLNQLWQAGKSKFTDDFETFWNMAKENGKVTYNASQQAKLLAPQERASMLAENSPDPYARQWEAVKRVVHQTYTLFTQLHNQDFNKFQRRKDLIRVIKIFNSTPPLHEVSDLVQNDQDQLDSIRASYAFCYDVQKTFTGRGNPGGFPWLMSFGPLMYLLNSNRRTALPIPITTLKRLTPHSSFCLSN
jgi:hypothetical protein